MTHGFNDNAEGWVSDIRDTIAQQIRGRFVGDSDVVVETLEWNATELREMRNDPSGGNIDRATVHEGATEVWEVVALDWGAMAPLVGTPLVARANGLVARSKFRTRASEKSNAPSDPASVER